MAGITIVLLAYMYWGKPDMKEYIRLLWYLGEPFPLRVDDRKIGVFSTTSDGKGNFVSKKPFCGFEVELSGLELENFSSNMMIVILQKVRFSWRGEHVPKFVPADSDRTFRYKFKQSYGSETVIDIFRLEKECFEIKISSQDLKSVSGYACFSLSSAGGYRVDLRTPEASEKLQEKYLDLPWDYFNNNHWALVF